MSGGNRTNGRTAVILFNLGGPDSLEAVRPFLLNLFSDPAIIRLPTPIRWLVARLIARRRAPTATEVYAALGGGSPIVANTQLQAAALETALGSGWRVFTAMRYWHPRARATAREVRAWKPDRVVMLPLYPQFSTTTTLSSTEEWLVEARRAGLDVPATLVCCWPRQAGFVEAVAERIQTALRELPQGVASRVLFSAHGLPERIVQAGDPYQWQVEATVAAVARRLDLPADGFRICYQSRVGRLVWLGPSTEAEIDAAGRDGIALVVVPIAFVSEHSETLVELDRDYGSLAQRVGVPVYLRTPTVDALPPFIAGLAEGCRTAARQEGMSPSTSPTICSGEGGRICPQGFGGCAFNKWPAAGSGAVEREAA